MRNLFFIPLLLILMLIMAIPDYAGDFDTGEYLKKNIVEKKLKNGVTLIMLNRGYAPVLAFEIAFKVGSADESYRTIGAAHLLEHMLFKGTDRIGTNNYRKERKILNKINALGETIDRLKLSKPKNTRLPALEKELKRLQKAHSKYVESSPYDKIYTSNGGVGFNASTSRDKTGYYVELPSSKLELWAKIESERLRNPVLREYYLERKNVIQERLMRTDSKGTGSLFEKFMAAAFISHPYRHPIIGWRSNIPYLSLRDVRNFYNKYYIPGRMTITIVGKQNTEETFKIINKYFNSIESRPDPTEISIREPSQSGEKRLEMNFKSSPYLIIGWKKPTFPSRDDYICDVISEILSGGKSSRLYKSLVLEKKLVSSVDTWNGGPGARYDNLFMIFATPKRPIKTEHVEKAIYREIDKFFEEVNEQEIQKVINRMESNIVFGLSKNKGIARLLSYYQTIFGDWRYSVNYLKRIKSITIQDIKKMKEKYFSKDNRTVGILIDSRKR